jgi:hypothetical protein
VSHRITFYNVLTRVAVGPRSNSTSDLCAERHRDPSCGMTSNDRVDSAKNVRADEAAGKKMRGRHEMRRRQWRRCRAAVDVRPVMVGIQSTLGAYRPRRHSLCSSSIRFRHPFALRDHLSPQRVAGGRRLEEGEAKVARRRLKRWRRPECVALCNSGCGALAHVLAVA